MHNRHQVGTLLKGFSVYQMFSPKIWTENLQNFYAKRSALKHIKKRLQSSYPLVLQLALAPRGEIFHFST